LIPLQFIGNKRSGSSYLTTLLNRIPEVFCTNESDVAWLLYQMDRHGFTNEEIAKGRQPSLDNQEFGDKSINPFVRHSLDVGSAGAVHTLRAVRFYGGEDAFTKGTVRTQYEAVQNMEWLHIRQGHTKRPFGHAIRSDLLKKEWSELAFLGDKMPTQLADPDVFNWWIPRFPETRFIHLVRDPRRVVSSMMRLRFNTWWRQEANEIFLRWAAIERWALDIERKVPDQVIRVHQEDMADDADLMMSDIITFLGLPKTVTFPSRETSQSIPIDAPDDPYVREVMEEYGYG
jgi:hypothetical protein